MFIAKMPSSTAAPLAVKGANHQPGLMKLAGGIHRMIPAYICRRTGPKLCPHCSCRWPALTTKLNIYFFQLRFILNFCLLQIFNILVIIIHVQPMRSYHHHQTSNISHTNGRQYTRWSLRCIWSSTCPRCSKFIFMLDSTPDFNGSGKDNCKMSQESFKFKDLEQFVLSFTVVIMECLSLIWQE